MTAPTLYFLHATGCEACEIMRPIVGRWWRENRDHVRVVPLDLTQVEWKATAWEPEVTPTLLVRRPDGSLSKPLLGAVSAEEFSRWVTAALR